MPKWWSSLLLSRERLRLSRELHDTLAHTLSAMAVQLEYVNHNLAILPQKAEQMIDQMLQTTRSGLDETRRALSALRASALEEMGLALALRTLAEDFRRGMVCSWIFPARIRSVLLHQMWNKVSTALPRKL